MPSISLDAKNTMLSALGVTTLSLHEAYSTNGLAEVSGGTPPYARLSVTFAAPFGGRISANNTPIGFDVPIGATVAWIGMWNALGNFMGMVPNGASTPAPFVVEGAAPTMLKCASHGFAVDDTFVVWKGSASALPVAPGSNLAEGTIYYVVAVPTVDSMQISTTLGGTALNFSTGGNGFFQRIVPLPFGSQGTFPIEVLSLDATVAA